MSSTFLVLSALMLTAAPGSGDTKARPTGAAGDGANAPLPPPPPSREASTIPNHTWRGGGFLSLRLHSNAPITGTGPARMGVVSIGADGIFGWRVHPLVAPGLVVGRHVHERGQAATINQFGEPAIASVNGYLTVIEPFVRIYYPTQGRFEPWLAAGGGVGFMNPAIGEELYVGGTARGEIGLDMWIGRTTTLSLGGGSRGLFLDGSSAASWHLNLEFGVHF